MNSLVTYKINKYIQYFNAKLEMELVDAIQEDYDYVDVVEPYTLNAEIVKTNKEEPEYHGEKR
jgi:hypothetical protein